MNLARKHPNANSLEAELGALYGSQAGELAGKVRAIAGAGAPRSVEGGWSEDDVLIITYPDQFQRVGERPLETLRRLYTTRLRGVANGVHILPCYPWTSDDGYAVTDYLAIDPAFGTWDDVTELAGETRVMLDAVVNHMSASSGWFRRFLDNDPDFAGFFRTADPEADLGATVRPRTSPLLTEFEAADGPRWVWTTFSADQVDLDYRNPEVFLAVAHVLYEYARRGADLIRLDAVQFIGKQEGTSSINLPEAHGVVRALRAALDISHPDVIIVTESNVPHEENIAYLGQPGEREAQMVYQFALAPLVLHTMITGDAGVLRGWASRQAPPRPGTTVLNFLASHDGVALRPAEGILSDDQANALVAHTIDAGGQVNYRAVAGGTKRAYEMACTWFDLMAHGYDEDAAVLRHLASHAIMLALRGVPLIYVHSLFGTGNDHALAARTGMARSLNRHKFRDVSALGTTLDDPATRGSTILQSMTDMCRARRSDQAFHPNADQAILDVDAGVFAVERGGRARVYVNVTGDVRPVHAPGWVDSERNGVSSLDPWQVAWLRRPGN